MKVLCVNSTIDPISGGGTAQRTVNLAKSLQRHGVCVSILSIDANTKNDKNFKNIEMHNLKVVLDRYQIPRFSVKYLYKIIEKSDVIHLMNHWTFITN